MLTFHELQEANVRRNEEVWQSLDAWNETDWGCAMAGEAGEACNIAKKRRRCQTMGKPMPEGSLEALKKEIADTVTYASLWAAAIGFDLGEAVREKFNEVSDRKGSQVRL